MSVVAIVVIAVVVVAILLGLFMVLPRMREKGHVRKQERELKQRRERAVSEQRQEADLHAREAEEAEQRARIAQQEAQRERAEAQLRQEKAAMHERGMADHELIGDHERDEFAGTSASPTPESQGPPVARDEGERERTDAAPEGRQAADDPSRVEDGQEEQEDQNGHGLFGRFRRQKEGQPAGRR